MSPSAAKEADWIDNRVRTMSSGYVHATEVIPAAPPHRRRRTGVISPGEISTNCERMSVSLTEQHPAEHDQSTADSRWRDSYPFVEVVAPELNSRVRHDPDAIRPITAHQALEAFFSPHLHQSLADREFVLFSPHALYLEKDLQPLQRRHYRSRYRPSKSSGQKGGEDRLSNGLPNSERSRDGRSQALQMDFNVSHTLASDRGPRTLTCAAEVTLAVGSVDKRCKEALSSIALERCTSSERCFPSRRIVPMFQTLSD